LAKNRFEENRLVAAGSAVWRSAEQQPLRGNRQAAMGGKIRIPLIKRDEIEAAQFRLEESRDQEAGDTKRRRHPASAAEPPFRVQQRQTSNSAEAVDIGAVSGTPDCFPWLFFARRLPK
jgi:hypothetical protein